MKQHKLDFDLSGKAGGFSLIELMIATAIIAILSAIAIPSYQEHVAKGRRGEATVALMEAAQALERYYSANGRYVTAAGGTTLPAVFPVQVPASGAAYYTLAAVAGSTGNNTFTLQATAIGAMASDECANFRLSHTGARTLDGNTRPVDQCWRR